jgi:hypothetical protein
MRNAVQHAVAQLRGQERVRRSLLGVAALGAVVAGVLSVPREGVGWSAGFHVAGLVLAAVIPLLFAITERSAAELVGDLGSRDEALADVRQENEALKHAYRRTIILYETARAVAEAADAVLLAPAETRDAIAERQLLAVLDRLVERKCDLFGMNDDRWTFTIYQLHGDKLVVRVTRRWSRSAEQGPHREWQSGDGHVGQAFKARRELICSNSNDGNVAGFLAAAAADRREYDTEVYVSFASVPIMIGDAETPRGVLSVTSDQAGRFVPRDARNQNPATPDAVEPLRVAASVIATIV